MEKSILADQRGQLSIEGIIGGIIVAIMYIITAAYVFQPIFNVMKPSLENTGGTYGTIASTLIMVAVYIVTPLLIVATIVAMARPRIEYTQ